MTDKSKLESATEAKAQTSPPKVEDAKEDQLEGLNENTALTGYGTAHPRRAGLSKREMMEQLSRERFPWDE